MPRLCPTEAHTFAPLEDLEALQLIQGQAMAWLYDKYSRFVYSVSLRILRDPAAAEDVLQDVFLRIWLSPEKLIVGQSLLPWMAVVSRNRSIDTIRKRPPSDSIEDDIFASPQNVALDVERDLMLEKARLLIDGLPQLQRTALEMAYVRGMTHAEIARQTGSPLGTIKTRIRNGLSRLREGFGQDGCAKKIAATRQPQRDFSNT